MNLEDMMDVAGEQLSSEPDQQGLPRYMIAANNHNVASGSGFSLLSPETWGDGASSLGKFALTATARAVTSVFNTVPDTINFFGGNVDTIDTYETISKFDQNLGDYYAENKKTVDVAGDLVGSFIPGMAGVKVLNMSQKALAAANAGRGAFNMSAATGLLPRAADFVINAGKYAGEYGFAAGKEAAAVSQGFKFLNANVLKSVAAGYTQNVLESAAFLGAAQVTMHSSPLFEDQDVKDIFWNSLGGGAVGGTILGSLAVARTYGAVKSGIKEADRLLNPASMFAAAERTATPTDKIAIAMHELYHPPVAPAGESEALIASFNNKLTARRDSLTNIIRNNVHEMTGDKELGNIFVDSMSQIKSYEDAIGNITYLKNLSRAGAKDTPLEKLTKLFKSETPPEGVAPNTAVKYVTLFGENAGQLSSDAPAVLTIADTVKHRDQILQLVGKEKFKLGQDFAPSAAKDHFQAEARYIWAQSVKPDWAVTTIADRDIPVLEKALQSGAESVQLKSGRLVHSDELFTYIQEAKRKEAYLLQEAYPKMTTAEIAKRVNVKQSLIEGEEGLIPRADWIAKDYSKNSTWENPQVAKLVYDVKPMMDQDGFIMDAVAHAKANQVELRNAANIAFAAHNGKYVDLYPERIGDKAIIEASRGGVGGGMASSMNENYGTIGSIAQDIGKTTNKVKTEITAAVDEKFNALSYSVLNNQAAKDDIVKAYNVILGSPEKYVLADDGVLRMRKLQQAMADGKGKFPAILDKNSPMEVKINSPEAVAFLKQWIEHNDSQLESTSARLAYQVGATPNARMQGTLYIPPPDPKNFNHFAFVTDASVTGTGHVKMIHAATEDALEQLVSKVNQTGDFKVILKTQGEEFQKAMQNYNYKLGINENYIDAGLARKGVSAPHFAVTDANKIISEMMDWRKRADVNNFREWLKLRYAPEMESLGQLAKSYDDLAISKKAYTGRFGTDSVKNPYSNIIKTMLDVSTKDEYPIWTPLNRLLENSVSRVYAKLQDAAVPDKSGMDELDRIHKVLTDAGIKANFTDPATMLLANHTAPKQVLEEFIRKGNSALSFFMLRADPLNAVNNGMGHTVLYGTETRDLVKNIQKGNAEAAGALAQLAKVKVPGSTAEVNLGEILSPTKLAANAYSDYAKMLAGNEESKAMAEFFKLHGWMPTLVDQEKSIMNALTLKGTESASELTKRIGQMKDAVKFLAKPATGFNQGVEDMNRFVSAHTAKSISDIAVKHGIITPGEQLSYINTFVNRTNGNYIANQRPMLFQGPLGQAVGLFQTYQFNLLQQLFRYAGEGQNKSVAMLLGLQGSIYGMNGLPAFNAINTHLVGNAPGNTAHKDIISQTYDTAGKEAGDWLMYGLASNMFLHPDAKVNLYSRGDINPRQVTVIPTNPADIPLVGATTKFFGSLKATASKLSAGGDVYSTLLQGVEHAGISRPLAGIAQSLEAFGNPNLQAYSTTSKGTLIGSNDLMSLTTFARISGGRPLDEAIANDAVYRINAYSAAKNTEINTLGAALKSKIQSGTWTTEDVNEFTNEYVKRGGKQDQFSKFMFRQMKSANISNANRLADDLKNPVNQNMQSVMGGMHLQDLANVN